MPKKPSGVPADLLVAVKSDPAPSQAVERASRTLRAMRVSPDAIGTSAVLSARDAALRFDPVRLGMGVDAPKFLGPEFMGTRQLTHAFDDSNARIARELLSGYSMVLSHFTKLSSAAFQTGEIVRRAMIDAIAPTAFFSPSIPSDFAKFSFAFQAVGDVLSKGTIGPLAELLDEAPHLAVGDALSKVTIGPLAVPPWDALNQRLRVRRWLLDLGSDDDPSSVELVEVDGIDFGQDFEAFWYAFLGEPVDGPSGEKREHVFTVDGLSLRVWGIRIYCDDTDSVGEIRYPPWGSGDLDLRGIDPFRPNESRPVFKGLRALGYGRRRGRLSLPEVWEREAFHRAYRRADEAVRPRRAGKRGSQLDIAAELNMSDRHLRRLIEMHGRPDE